MSNTQKMPPAGVIISPLTKKRNANEPAYDDFMNSVFSNKQHKSYFLREKADLRSEILRDKFLNGLDKGAGDESRINAEFDRKVKQTAQQLEDRMQKQK